MASLCTLPRVLVVLALTFLNFNEICVQKAVCHGFANFVTKALQQVETAACYEHDVFVYLICRYGHNIKRIVKGPDTGNFSLTVKLNS